MHTYSTVITFLVLITVLKCVLIDYSAEMWCVYTGSQSNILSAEFPEAVDLSGMSFS